MVGADVGNIAFGMLPAALTAVRPDIIHVHTYRFFPTWLVPFLRIVKHVPVVMTTHSAYEPMRPNRIKLFDSTWGKVIFKAVSRVIALTEIERQYLISLGLSSDKILIIPNAVDSAILDYKPNIPGFKEKYHLVNKKLVLFVGRIGLGKGLDTLVDAIPGVIKKIQDDVRFVFVGPDWGDREILEKQAELLGVGSSVLFTGPIVGNGLLDAYHASDVVVLLSRFDASPIVLVEAMAAAKPVVAARVGGIPDIVIDGTTGILVEPRNSTSAADAILNLLCNERLASQFGQAGKALVRERYQSSVVVKEIVNLYAACNRHEHHVRP